MKYIPSFSFSFSPIRFLYFSGIDLPNEASPSISVNKLMGMDHQEKHQFILNIKQGRTPENIPMALKNLTLFDDSQQETLLKNIPKEHFNLLLSNISDIRNPRLEVYVLKQIETRVQLDLILNQFEQLSPLGQFNAISKAITMSTQNFSELDSAYFKKYAQYGYKKQEGLYDDFLAPFSFEARANDTDYNKSYSTLRYPDRDPQNQGGFVELGFSSQIATPEAYNLKNMPPQVKTLVVFRFNSKNELISGESYFLENEQIRKIFQESYTYPEYDEATGTRQEKTEWITKENALYGRQFYDIFREHLEQGKRATLLHLERAVSGPRMAYEAAIKQETQENHQQREIEINQADEKLKEDFDNIYKGK